MSNKASLERAHNIGARASGRLALALATGKLSKVHLRSSVIELREAADILEGLLSV